MSLRNTRQNAQFVYESEDNNDITLGSGLKSWKPHLSTLKDAGFDASKWMWARWISKSALLCRKMFVHFWLWERQYTLGSRHFLADPNGQNVDLCTRNLQ